MNDILNPNFNQIQFNPNLMQNNLLNNNQIRSKGISIDYEKEIEKNAKENFKFYFYENFEVDYCCFLMTTTLDCCFALADSPCAETAVDIDCSLSINSFTKDCNSSLVTY